MYKWPETLFLKQKFQLYGYFVLDSEERVNIDRNYLIGTQIHIYLLLFFCNKCVLLLGMPEFVRPIATLTLPTV